MTGGRPLEDTLNDLRGLLQEALIVELSTIPAYATACYSIREQGQYDRSAPEVVNAEPIEVIRQVMVEEMLHLVLAANVLNAIGGRPVLTDTEQLPTYPYALLKGKGPTLRLRRFTPDQVKAFREVERAPDHDRPLDGNEYHTIAGFYSHLIGQLKDACERYGEERIFAHGAEGLQIGPDDYYGSGGEVVVVGDLASALEALDCIVEEGEGFCDGKYAGDGDLIPGPERREDIAHYFKFDEILHSRYYVPDDHVDGPPRGGNLRVNWDAVWPMQDDPKHEKYQDHPEIEALSHQFNRSWSALLDGLETALNGHKENLVGLIPLMYQLKEDAQRLMRVPLPDKSGETAGPTWEYCGPPRAPKIHV